MANSNFLTVNGREFRAKEVDFNFLCELSENGIDVSEVDKKIIPAVRVYVAYCMGTSLEVAGNEINLHIVNGGALEDLITVFAEKTENSGFFRALTNKGVQKETTKRNSKKKDEDGTE